MNGAVLIDKPAGCTSHDVVNRWRRLANTKRVGHLGTLDPLATGLLVLVTGTATRLAQYFGREDKTYLAEIAFGMVSDTYDADGEIVHTARPLPASGEVICSALSAFRGRSLQTPPPISAKKVHGVRAYKLARQKEPVNLTPVEVEMKRLEVQSVSPERLQVLVTCTAGTYIRSLAHDLGARLGCGALLTKLRRTQAGEFTVDQAKSLDQLADLAAEGQLSQAIIPSGCLLPEFPAEYFNALAEAHIRQGRDFRTSPFVVRPCTPFVKALSHDGELIAIGELKMPNLYHPSTVF